MIGQGSACPHPRLPTGGTCAWYPSQHDWDPSLPATCAAADQLPRLDPGVLRHDGTNANAGVGHTPPTPACASEPFPLWSPWEAWLHLASSWLRFARSRSTEHASFEGPSDQVGYDDRTDVLRSSHCAPRERPSRRPAGRTPPQLTTVCASRTHSKEPDGRTRQRPGPSRRPTPVTTPRRAVYSRFSPFCDCARILSVALGRERRTALGAEGRMRIDVVCFAWCVPWIAAGMPTHIRETRHSHCRGLSPARPGAAETHRSGARTVPGTTCTWKANAPDSDGLPYVTM